MLFTSGYTEPGIARLGVNAGAWLKKPYTADELAEKVHQVFTTPGFERGPILCFRRSRVLARSTSPTKRVDAGYHTIG